MLQQIPKIDPPIQKLLEQDRKSAFDGAGWTARDQQLAINLQELRRYRLCFSGRNHKQLKDHYENYLRPDLSKEEWTLEEDLELIDLFNTYGKDWRLIQDKMSSRSRNQIKNRFFGRILRLDAKKREA